MDFSSVDFLGSEVPQSREEEVDLTLLKNDSGVESALLYAKTCSKYIKDLLAWMEKRLAIGETTDSISGWKQWSTAQGLGHYIRYFSRKKMLPVQVHTICTAGTVRQIELTVKCITDPWTKLEEFLENCFRCYIS